MQDSMYGVELRLNNHMVAHGCRRGSQIEAWLHINLSLHVCFIDKCGRLKLMLRSGSEGARES